jgi:hypothetical protein
MIVFGDLFLEDGRNYPAAVCSVKDSLKAYL